jgi:hypothetical protein
MKFSQLKAERKKIKDIDFWEERNPQKGEHIRLLNGFFYHHALYISDEQVFHFAYGEDGIFGNQGFLEMTDFQSFKGKRRVEVRKYSDEEKKLLYPINERIHRATIELGEKKYDVLFCNCEHYISYFTIGKFESRQVNQLVDKPILKSSESGINTFLSAVYNQISNKEM